jgi:hypothetical protein
MNKPGPVSAILEEELRTWVRRHGVVLWLDRDEHFTAFVDGLAQRRTADDLPYAVHAWRGSHLALMMQLERTAAGVDRSHVLIHLPGFNEEAVKQTPLFELYAAGVRFRKKLSTLVTEAAAGRVKPDQIEAYIHQGTLSLEGADAWLATLLDDGEEGGLAAQLRAMKPGALLDDLLDAGYVAGRLRAPQARDVLWAQLGAWTGLSVAWRDAALPVGSPKPADIAFAAASWALAVEYVDDLERPPADERLQLVPSLPRSVLDTCCELAAQLRQRRPEFYQRTADETEGWLVDEVELAQAELLGSIDTFRFEEDCILEAALAALEDEQWSQALEWADTRLGGGSFWLQRDASREAAWKLVQGGALLGSAIQGAGTSLVAGSLDEAVDRYVSTGMAVDQAHRTLEQRRTALLYPLLPEFEALRGRLDGLRALWRAWADLWASDFNKLCRQQGFLPSTELQQRNLFDEVVRPLTKDAGITALFVVDALRFEMGDELFRAIQGTPATTAKLSARLAELPTVTEVGMNVLAPVAHQGRLVPRIDGDRILGFSAGEFLVKDPDTRVRAMWDRVGGGSCPKLSLSEVLQRDSTSLKKGITKAKLVVVHSQEIDAAGEKGVGPAVFDVVMQKLRAAWRLLREAGVRRFVFTADHGFLLLDETARNAQPHGRKSFPSRRHVVSPVAADHTGEARVPLADLGYTGATAQLMFPETTAVFDKGRRSASFVHGGNSLQERVIPVLTVLHRAAAGGDTLRYQASGKAAEGLGDWHCLLGQVQIVAQGALAFGGTREIELGLRVVEPACGQVELVQIRRSGTLAGGSIQAQVGEEFELFFKLSGDADTRVQVELFHPGAVVDVTPGVAEGRFLLSGSGDPTPTSPSAATSTRDRAWLDALPQGGVRQVFEHLAAHGMVTEADVIGMLGSGRKARSFANRFELYADKAPFSTRIDSVGGIKRYVREGSTG